MPLLLKGVVKKVAQKEFTKKDGSTGKEITLFVECPERVYPYKVNWKDYDNIPKEGSKFESKIGYTSEYWDKEKSPRPLKARTKFYSLSK